MNGLNVTNTKPVLVQLRISNNKRNLQIQLAPVNGLNLTVMWTKQAYANNASDCDSACVQSTLTTNKCGVVHPLIPPVTILGAATKVVSDTTLDLKRVPRPTFLWTDGFQTAFTDEHGESNALAVSGVGAGFVWTITTPRSKFGTVVRVFVGVRGATGQLTAALDGITATHYNETFASVDGASKFGVVVLQVPASATAVQVRWALVGPSANGSVLLGAIAVQGVPNRPASGLRATQSETEREETDRQTPTPARKCAEPPATGRAGTMMLQAAVLM